MKILIYPNNIRDYIIIQHLNVAFPAKARMEICKSKLNIIINVSSCSKKVHDSVLLKLCIICFYLFIVLFLFISVFSLSVISLLLLSCSISDILTNNPGVFHMSASSHPAGWLYFVYFTLFKENKF